MTLLPGERVVLSSGGGILLLTSMRVRYSSVRMASSGYVSVTLDSISSCGLVTRSLPNLLVLAGVCFLAAVVLNREGAMAFAVGFVGLVLVAAYVVTRQAVISITSSGGQAILVPIRQMRREEIVGFLDALDHAKLHAGGRA